jgi:hypothetical protein
VRLQLDRDGHVKDYASRAEVDEQSAIDRAPNLDIGQNQVRLDGLQYHISLRLRAEDDGSELDGTLTLNPDAGRSLPPLVIRGARGWLSGYVVPVLSGRMSGAITLGRETISLEGASGYHDHNWGFWRDVRWQWGQVADGDLSLVYGRVFPPADVADADRMPGFLGVLDRRGDERVDCGRADGRCADRHQRDRSWQRDRPAPDVCGGSHRPHRAHDVGRRHRFSSAWRHVPRRGPCGRPLDQLHGARRGRDVSAPMSDSHDSASPAPAGSLSIVGDAGCARTAAVYGA